MAYKNYDKQVDYSIRLDEMMAAGASAQEVQDTLNQRVSKALDNEELRQYAYDSAYTKAREYIDRQSALSLPQAVTGSGTGSRRTSQYEERLAAALDAYENREPFSYDPESDPAYQSYRSMYRREGDRARREAIGSAAALTGGQASTAAVAAASQAQDYYNSKLGDAIPGLYELAYQMYQDEGDDLLTSLNYLAKLTESEIENDRADREFAYKLAKDERDYRQSMYESTKSRDDDDRARGTSAENEAHDRAMAFLNAGVMPTDAMLKAAGMDKTTAESYRAAALRKLNKK